MGALSNDMRKLAYYSGFYKGIQSVGAAIIFRVDAKKVRPPILPTQHTTAIEKI
jgi:hypothetical protein